MFFRKSILSAFFGQNYSWTSPEKNLKNHQIVGFELHTYRLLYLNCSKSVSKKSKIDTFRFAFFGQYYPWTSRKMLSEKYQTIMFGLLKTSISIPELLQKCIQRRSKLTRLGCLKHRFLYLNFSKYKTSKSLRKIPEQENQQKTYRSSLSRGGSLVPLHMISDLWKCPPLVLDPDSNKGGAFP